MKKLFFSAVALATLLFAACQQEKLETAEGGNAVTFTVDAPGALTSKALAAGQVIADGTNVNEVHYAVYKPGSTGAYSLENPQATPLAQGFVPMADKHATITFDLLKNQDYVVIFWAQVKDAGHYTLGDLRTIAMNATVDGNDETRAAFYKKYEFNTNVKSHSVELVRPFAQLNLLTTLASLAPQQPGQTQGYTIDVLKSEVSVTGLSTTFDTVSGTAPESSEVITFTLNATPAKQGQQTLSVNDVDYHYVSMNYFFVPEDEALVEISYSIDTNPGENSIINTIDNVPVKENYRTNIIGNLLTTGATFEIVVDQRFNEPALPDNEADELNIAAQLGGTFVLNSDIELTSPIVVNENSQLILDLNGHTITGTVGRDAENARVHVIVNNGNLVISNGTVTSAGMNGGSAILNAGDLKVNNVTLNGAPNEGTSWPSYTFNNKGTAVITDSYITSYHGAVATYGAEAVTTLNDTDVEMAGIEGFTSHGLYVYDAGKTYVNGGSIANRAADQASTGGSVINGEVYVSAGEFTGRI